MINDIFHQINTITTSLIRESLAKTFNFPVKDNVNSEIYWSGYKSISFLLRNKDYSDLYNRVIQNKEYNIMLLDGAIIQMMYKFDNNAISEHRLLYMPSPTIPDYEDYEGEFEEKFYELLFGDITNDDIMVFPIRFDYKNCDETYEDLNHPYSHITLGNFKNCRIPVCSPITPNRFISFIIRNFYNSVLRERPDLIEAFSCNIDLPSSISNNEKRILHLNYII